MHHSHPGHSHDSSGNLKVAFFLNAGFTILEIAGGLWTSSFAILADALHDAGDSASLGLAWYFERLSRRGRTTVQSYGFVRYRLLGGLITAVLLTIGLGFVLWHAVGRLADPQPVNAAGMLAIAVVGIVVNGAAVMRVKKGTSLTEKLVSWHLIEDTLGWAAVLIGAAVMNVWDVPIVDPLLSIGISLFVLWNIGRNLKQVMRVFLQNTPDSFDLEEFTQQVESMPGVVATHHVHCWSLDGENHVLTAHLVVEKDTPRERIAAIKLEAAGFLDPEDFQHVTFDVEMEGEPCASGSEDSSH